MQSIDVARQREDEWPEWELFWPQHPVCEWLDDRVLCALGRHEAWVVRVPDGLDPDDCLFLFQGVYSNQRSQSVLVDWFAVPFQGNTPQDVIPREEAIRRSGLIGVQGNPAIAHVPDMLASLRMCAVEAARTHMQDLRSARATELAGPLRDGMRALIAWRDSGLRLIKERRMLAAKGGATIPGPIRRRLNAEEREVQAAYEARRQWIERGLQTVTEPYLRLAAVFVRADLA